MCLITLYHVENLVCLLGKHHVYLYNDLTVNIDERTYITRHTNNNLGDGRYMETDIAGSLHVQLYMYVANSDLTLK